MLVMKSGGKINININNKNTMYIIFIYFNVY